MSNKISNERKGIYYVGLFLMILGFILFMSSFFVLSDPVSMNSIHFGPTEFLKRPVIGMICIVVGAILSNVGARGAAGSGLILDPEKARDDLKPFNTAKGEMINDVLENIDVVKNISDSLNDKASSKETSTKEIIKVRCRSCQTLNDEDAKFCKNCGHDMF